MGNGSGDTPNTSNLIALAKLYKISLEELLECAAGTSKDENDIEGFFLGGKTEPPPMTTLQTQLKPEEKR